MGTSNLLKNDASYINEKMCLLNVLNLQSKQHPLVYISVLNSKQQSYFQKMMLIVS